MHPALLYQQESLQSPSCNWSKRAATGRSGGMVLQNPAQGQASRCHPKDRAEQGARHLNPFLSISSATRRSSTQVTASGQCKRGANPLRPVIRTFSDILVHMQVNPAAVSGKCRSRSTHNSSRAATSPLLFLCKDKECQNLFNTNRMGHDFCNLNH